MASPSFSHPHQRPPVHAGGIRRSFTQPPRSLSFHEKAGLDPSDSAADILYSHPRARIVSFTPPTDAVRSGSSPGPVDLDYPVDTIETLPWASSTEEILASGSLIIEKIRGSTNFLKSGTKPLHALMRNSQCWCVDGEATLVMRVGAFKYYRIELPYDTEADKADVQRLKDVLKRILRFETTPCPFKRGFHVDLPESATTPRRKGPWKRRPGSFLTSPSSASPSPLSHKKLRAQPAPREQDNQNEIEASHEDLEDVSEAGSDDTSSLEDEDDSGQPRIAIDSDGSHDRIESDSPSTPQTPDILPNSTSILEESRAPPTEANGGAEEGEDMADDQPLLSPLAAAHPSLESSDEQLQNGSHENLKSSELEEGPHAGNDPSPSLDRFGIEDENPELLEESGCLSDQETQLPPDTPSSLTDLDVVPENLFAVKDVVPNELEQPTPNNPSDLSDSVEILPEILPEHDPLDKGEGVEGVEVVEADEADEDRETDLKSGIQPAELEGSERVCPATATISTIETSPESDSVEVGAAEIADDFDPQEVWLESDAKVSDTASVSSRADSFYSITSSEHPSSAVEAGMIESPPYMQHRRDYSDMTVTVASASTLESDEPFSPLRPLTATSEDPSTPSLLRSSASDSSWPEVETPTAVAPNNELHRRMRKKRSFSPLPPSSTLTFPAPQSPLGTHLTGAILQKACNLALGKPIEVVFMLFHILTRIAAGATYEDYKNGDLLPKPAKPGTAHGRNHSLPNHSDSHNGEASEDDDYGVPIRGRSRNAVPKVRNEEDADSLFDLD
jgi:Inheritance of peroxisomes protein 1